VVYIGADATVALSAMLVMQTKPQLLAESLSTKSPPSPSSSPRVESQGSLKCFCIGKRERNAREFVASTWRVEYIFCKPC
jgi:hypothetical protein